MDEGRRDRVLDHVVTLLLEMRAEYLANGANALKHWQQLQDRALLATRTSSRISEWVTTLGRELQLGNPSSSRSSATMALIAEVDADDGEALDAIEDQLGVLMARARVEAERRRDEREAANAAKGVAHG